MCFILAFYLFNNFSSQLQVFDLSMMSMEKYKRSQNVYQLLS
jgi:hypothetical protein